MGLFIRRAGEQPRLKDGRIYWVDDVGEVHDLGICTLEDLKLTAYVTEVAYKRLTPAKARARSDVLGRVKSFAKRLYTEAQK
jgi:hypothetical protein